MTLEWQVSSPPPVFNFDRVPTVVGGPYEYGVPGAVHGIFAPPPVPADGRRRRGLDARAEPMSEEAEQVKRDPRRRKPHARRREAARRGARARGRAGRGALSPRRARRASPPRAS